MRIASYLCVVLSFLALATSLRAQDTQRPIPDAEIAAWEAEKFLDDAEAARQWIAALRDALPRLAGGDDWARLQAELYLRKASSAVDRIGKHTEESAQLDALLAEIAEADVPELFRDAVKYRLVIRATAANDREAAEKGEVKLGFVSDWLVLGPFENRNNGGYDRDFGPETDLLFDKTYDGKVREVRWRRNPVDARRGYVNLGTLFSPSDHAIAYAFTGIHVEKETDIALRFGTSNGGKLFVNGQEVWAREIRRDEMPDQDSVAVKLLPGWNSILFKVGCDDGEWAYRLRISAPHGGSVEGLTISADPKSFEGQELNTTCELVEDADLGILSRVDALATDTTDDARLYLYKAILSAFVRSYDKDRPVIREILEQALNIAPDDPHLSYHFARYASNDARMAAERNDNDARHAFEKTIKLDPEYVAAWLELSSYYLSAFRNVDKSWELFQEAEAHAKETPSWIARRISMYSIRGWGAQAIDLGRMALEANPDSMILTERNIRLFESLQPKKAMELRRRVVEKMNPLNISYLLDIARHDLRQGRFEAGYAHLDYMLWLEPYATQVFRLRAALARPAMEYEEGLKWIEKALEINPEDASTWRLKGDYLHAMDRNNEAVVAWNRALELEPKLLDLREYMDAVLEKQEAWETPYRQELKQVLAGAPEDSHYGDTGGARLYDRSVTILNPDGTKNLYRHQVFKILKQTATEDYQVQRIGYYAGEERLTVLRARIIRPDGSIAEARTSTAGGRFSEYRDWSVYPVELPTLNEGDLIEIEYKTEDIAQNFFGEYFGDIHTFGNFEPIWKMEYHLVTPKDLEIYTNLRNSNEKSTVTDNGESMTRSWVFTDLSRVISEPRMPELSEIVPTLQVSTYKDWDTFSEWYWNLIKKQHVLTDEMRAKLKELVKGLDDPKDQIRAVYHFVISEIRYEAWEFGVHGFKPYLASDIFKRKFGDCKDKALLINVLLQELGFDSRPVLISLEQGPRSTEDIQLPMFEHFNHCISCVTLEDGERWFLDGTASFWGADAVPTGDSGASVVLVSEGGAELETVPLTTPQDYLEKGVYIVRVAEDGNAQLDVSYSQGGAGAAAYRYYFSTEDKRPDIIEKMYARAFPGMTVDKVDMSNFNAFNEPLRYTFTATVKNIGKNQGNRLILPAVVRQSTFSDYASQATRIHDLLIESPYREEYTYVIALPEGWTVDELPDNTELTSPFGSYTQTFERQDDGSISVHRAAEISTRRVKAGDYEAFREFCRQADQAEEQELTVRKEGN